MSKTIKITFPNGKVARVTGDRTPTQEELNSMYQSYFPDDYNSDMQSEAGAEVKADAINGALNDSQVELKSELKPDLDKGGLALLFLEGLTFNLSDEAISFVNATSDSMFDDVSFSEAYETHRELYKERMDKVKADNPALAMTAEIGGSIANPLNFMGKVSGLRVVAESALSGFGTGDGGIVDRLDDAAIGGATGGAGYSVMKVGGSLYDKLTKTKLENLQQEGGQIPITLARPLDADATGSTAQTFYRTAVYPSFAGGKLRADEGKFIRGVEGQLKGTKSGIASFTDESKVLHEQARKELDSSAKALDLELKQAKTQVDIDSPESAVKGVYTQIRKDLDSGERVSNVGRRISELISADEATFMKLAFDKSMPSFLRTQGGAEVLEAMNSAQTANEAFGILRKAFQNHGFDSIKDSQFRVTDSFMDDALDAARKAVVAEKDFDSTAIAQTTANYLEMITESAVNGVVDGRVLAQVRANLGSLRSQNSGANMTAEQAKKSQVLSAVQSKLDDLIESQLPSSSRAAFLADKDAWKHFKVLNKTVLGRSGGGAEQGRFTPSDWADANKVLNPRFAVSGEAPLFKEAETLIIQHKKSSEAASRYADKLKDRIEKKQAYNLGKLKNETQKKKNALEKDTLSAKNNMRNNPELLETIAQNKATIDELNATLNGTSEYLSTLKELRSYKNPTLWHTQNATNILGGVAGFGKDVYGGARRMVMGTGVGLVARSDLAQRIAAKQTLPQEIAQNASNLAIPNPLAKLGNDMGLATDATMPLREGMLRVGNASVRSGLLDDEER